MGGGSTWDSSGSRGEVFIRAHVPAAEACARLGTRKGAIRERRYALIAHSISDDHLDI